MNTNRQVYKSHVELYLKLPIGGFLAEIFAHFRGYSGTRNREKMCKDSKKKEAPHPIKTFNRFLSPHKCLLSSHSTAL